ncbi:hypothetical protein VULLAG_LOCUS6797 [Vulpes lagopus]
MREESGARINISEGNCGQDRYSTEVKGSTDRQTGGMGSS